ncbi:MAG: hypothetical protein JXA73_22250 [Acidobacteria bacterium]|nr:hypothetical protein [Acidobacteriota bacterium]
MKIPALLTVLIVLFLAPNLSSRQSSPAVAIVSEIQGEANVLVASENPKPLKLFKWLCAGSMVKVNRNSRLVLAFENGSRYELSAGAEVTLLDDNPEIHRGAVKKLKSFPPMPHFSPIAARAEAGLRAGAIRIRGDAAIAWVYPRSGNTTMPESTILVFAAVPHASRYRVTIKSETGKAVYEKETAGTEVAVPRNIIVPGERYSWTVAAMRTKGSEVYGFGEFLALDSGAIQARTRLKHSLETKKDAQSLALLAAIDRRLGLLFEAMNEFEAALAKSGGDPVIRLNLDEVKTSLFQTQSK